MVFFSSANFSSFISRQFHTEFSVLKKKKQEGMQNKWQDFPLIFQGIWLNNKRECSAVYLYEKPRMKLGIYVTKFLIYLS